MTTIPFHAALDTEAQVSAVVDALAITLAGHLDAGPWRGPGVWHQWTPDAAEPYVGRSAKMARAPLTILVSYSISGAAIVPSFVATVMDCDRCILEASWAQAAWHVARGDAHMITTLQRACAAVMARLADV
jgi:hypothetical protein